MSKTFSAKSAAVRAARAALGPEAIPGTDFSVKEDGGRWIWSEMGAAPSSDTTLDDERGAAADLEEQLANENPDLAMDGPDSGARKIAEAAKPAKAPKGKAAEILAAAERGELPPKPDFSADTHKRWRPKLEEVVAMAEAGDLKGLKAYAINPVSTSPKAIDRYRNLAVIALEARKKAA